MSEFIRSTHRAPHEMAVVLLKCRATRHVVGRSRDKESKIFRKSCRHSNQTRICESVRRESECLKKDI